MTRFSIDTSRETPQVLATAKEGVKFILNQAKKTAIGSGKLGEEIRDTGSAVVDGTVESVVTPLRALKDVATLHPIKAIKDTVKGGMAITSDVFTAATSPSRLAVGGVVASAKTVSAVAKTPFQIAGAVAKSPLWVFRTCNAGVDKVMKAADRLERWNMEGTVPKPQDASPKSSSSAGNSPDKETEAPMAKAA